MSKGKNIAYVRVSTVEQNEARQREALGKYNIDKWFIEKASGKTMKRPKLQEMLGFIREDDVVYVEEFSRLGRTAYDLLSIVKRIENTGAKFVSLKENFDTSTPTGRLQLTMMAAIAEFEREMILERQREGIAIAKKEGRSHIYISTGENGLYEKYGYIFWKIMKDADGHDSRVYKIEV